MLLHHMALLPRCCAISSPESQILFGSWQKAADKKGVQAEATLLQNAHELGQFSCRTARLSDLQPCDVNSAQL